MSFIHPALLAGLVLAAVPVLLHLILRQEPKRLRFPAFQFLARKALSNRRKLQLRHWLLLLLRIVMVALMCLALARPRVVSDRLHLGGDRPVAAAIIIDTSASMGYLQGTKARLDDAKTRALELIDALPTNSRFAVLDSAESGGEWQPNAAAAKERIATRELRASGGTVTDSVAAAYRLFGELASKEGDAPSPRFVYVFTDRAPGSWDNTRWSELAEARDRLAGPPVNHLLVDFGTDKPADAALLEVLLRPQVLPANRPVELRVVAQATGHDVDTQVVCRVIGQTEAEAKPLKLSAGRADEVVFRRIGLKPGLHQAEIAIETSDALPADNTQYVTFELREPRPVLIIADDPAAARPLEAALRSAYPCDVKVALDPALATMTPAELSRYRAVCLVSVAWPSKDLWAKLESYVTGGGGLAIMPGGDELSREAYNQGPGTKLMPGTLTALVDGPPDGVVWLPQDYQHPLLAPFRDDANNPETGFAENPPRTYRYWDVTPTTGQVLVRYGDEPKRPALLETQFDRSKVRGKVLLFTTPFDGRSDAKGRPWNDYATWWFYVALTNRTVRYLAGPTEDAIYNFVSGAGASVVLPPDMRATSFTLTGPGLTAAESRVTRPDDAFVLRLPQARSAGNYTLSTADRSWSTGFSVNTPPVEFQLLPRVTAETLGTLFGPDGIVEAGRDISLKEKLDSHFRQPLELLPWLLLVLLCLLVAESFFANRFYRRAGPSSETPRTVNA